MKTEIHFKDYDLFDREYVSNKLLDNVLIRGSRYYITKDYIWHINIADITDISDDIHTMFRLCYYNKNNCYAYGDDESVNKIINYINYYDLGFNIIHEG